MTRQRARVRRGSSPGSPVLVGLSDEQVLALDDAAFLVEQIDTIATARGAPPNARRALAVTTLRQLVEALRKEGAKA